MVAIIDDLFTKYRLELMKEKDTSIPKRLFIISELYYPEETSTGHFLTGIGEGMAQEHSVFVLCSQPTYSERGIRAPSREVRHGVSIRRCWGTRFNKNIMPLRILNSISMTLSLFFSAALRLRSGDKVLVVTNPPILPFFVLMACKIRRARLILLVHDVYPDVLAASGICSQGALLYRIIGVLSLWVQNRADRVVAIGRDMANVLSSRGTDNIEIVTNWADLDEIVCSDRRENDVLKKLSIADRFVVQYCGNMGRTHGLEHLVDAAQMLVDTPTVYFLLIGTGAKRRWIEREIGKRNLRNISVIDRCDRDQLSEYLNACDLAIISFGSGMLGISVPSRMYNIMAAGKPILAVADQESELARVVTEESIGWVVPPEGPKQLAQAIIAASADLQTLTRMGAAARCAAEKKYTLDLILAQYERVFASIS